MGVECKVCLVDHEHVVVRGFPLLAEAARTGRLDELRRHLRSKPWESDPLLVRSLEARLNELHRLEAPDVLLDPAMRALREARGEHLSSEFDAMGYEELRLAYETASTRGFGVMIEAWE